MPPHAEVRPTPDRVREMLFNWLGQSLEGRRCLDLFAGSGALGFEAASRGAAHVVLVEKDPNVVRVLERTLAELEASNSRVVLADALAWVESARERFDVVFLDPPFRQNVLAQLLSILPRCLEKGARVYVESAAPIEMCVPWREVRRSRAGQVNAQLMEWNPDDSSRVPGNL